MQRGKFCKTLLSLVVGTMGICQAVMAARNRSKPLV